MGHGRDRPRSTPPRGSTDATPPDPDPYLPGHGDPRFTVRHYDLALDYRLTTNALRAVATLTVAALEPIDTLTLDLHGLAVRKVRVDGTLAKHRHTGSRLVVRLPDPLPAGATATVRVSYAGRPAPVDGPHGEAGWEELADGILVASQPYGSPSWFPCNDRVSDKATYHVAVTTESDYTVVVTGEGSKPRREAGRRRWTFEQQPRRWRGIWRRFGKAMWPPCTGTGGQGRRARPDSRGVLFRRAASHAACWGRGASQCTWQAQNSFAGEQESFLGNRR